MDRCLKDKAHFIIAQTIWNNKNGKAVFAEQVFDRCQRKFQDEINRELYKLIEEGGGGGTGKDGKTPVLKAGEITSLPYGAEPTFKLVYEGNNHEGNPVYRMDLGLPQGKPGEDGISLVSDCSYIKTVTIKTLGQSVDASYIFNRCYELEEVTLINELNVTTLQGFCFMCTKLNKINGIIDASGVTNTNQFLDGSAAKLISEVWIKNLSTSIYITSPNFTKECCLYMFNNATTVTGNIVVTLNDAVYNNLTADERAILTNKGFTLRGGGQLIN